MSELEGQLELAVGPVAAIGATLPNDGKVAILIHIPAGYDLVEAKTFDDASIEGEDGEVVLNTQQTGGVILRLTLEDPDNLGTPRLVGLWK